ncbi:hypothetical protein F5X99DRAFT_353693 [Biscogniauxia marginata]|nr:hypothetical protein F5X99DRAFT_353693 [Biscogniauxia marginata]
MRSLRSNYFKMGSHWISSVPSILIWWLSTNAPDGVTGSYISPRVQGSLVTTSPLVFATRATESFTAVSDCHLHGSSVFCSYGTTELQVIIPATVTNDLPATYTDCHTHGDESFCVGPDGLDVEVVGLRNEESHDGEEHNHTGEESSEEQKCHFHAGVEHCVGDASESSTNIECSRRDRDYNILLRIGLLFVVLVTSLIGAVGPILLKPILPAKLHGVFIVLKQFGTGVIIATAFVHLYTHAYLMFTNECLGEIGYEATTSAILMAGLFVAFLVEHASHRLARRFLTRFQYSDEVVSVMILEAGIIFHSILVGLTLVVAGDSVFITLFVVIVFHQAFEGIALGTRIASMGSTIAGGDTAASHVSSETTQAPKPTTESPTVSSSLSSDKVEEDRKSLSTTKKLIMAGAFAITTPIGMAIGVGVLHRFNGNDPSTIVAIGTLDAFSAGILVWVGVVEMWAGDWTSGGELANAGLLVTTMGGVGLVAGMALMSFLGNWA